MKIEIINQQGVPIELQPVAVAGVTFGQTDPIPVEVKNKKISVEPQQQPNIAINIL